MKHAKSVVDPQWTGRMTTRIFVRAARFVTLLIVGLVSVEFLIMAALFRDGVVLALGFVLITLMALAIWVIAASMATVALLARWLWEKWRCPVLRGRRSLAAPSAVWDIWLDGPGPL
jgi:hypothetical protein